MTRNLDIHLPGALRGVEVVSARRQGAVPARRRPGRANAAAEARLAEATRQMAEQLQQERAHLAQARQALLDAARQFGEFRARLLAEAEGQLLELALEIARKVLMQQVQAERYEIEPIVAEALRHVPAGREVVVHLHPADHAQCSLADASADDAGGVRYLADPSVRRAECVLETHEGIVESTVETHLAEIAEALREPE